MPRPIIGAGLAVPHQLSNIGKLGPQVALDAERLHRLENAWLGERVTEEEARAIGNALVAGPLSTVNWVSKVFPPSSYFRDARGDHRDYDKDTQWPAWLRALAEFCLTCKGFEVC